MSGRAHAQRSRVGRHACATTRCVCSVPRTDNFAPNGIEGRSMMHSQCPVACALAGRRSRGTPTAPTPTTAASVPSWLSWPDRCAGSRRRFSSSAVLAFC
eukprot:4126383-Pleurochrysis_carterae.AAC.1